MSAAEKLGALDGAMTPWGSTWESDLGGLYADEGLGAYIRTVSVDYEGGLPRDLVLSIVALRNALPEIIAVVKAAEELPEFFHVGVVAHSFVPLLDALDEKLGDVT